MRTRIRRAMDVVDMNSVVSKTGSRVSHLDSLIGGEKPLKVLNKYQLLELLISRLERSVSNGMGRRLPAQHV